MLISNALQIFNSAIKIIKFSISELILRKNTAHLNSAIEILIYNHGKVCIARFEITVVSIAPLIIAL
jgi:hypothetical protein